MHAISSYRDNRPTNKQTQPQTGPITIHCAAASVQCNYTKDSGSRNTGTRIKLAFLVYMNAAFKLATLAV